MPERTPSGLPVFFAALAVLIVLNLLLGFVPVPPGALVAIGLFVTVVFVALPILGLYKAADHPWSPRLAALFVAAGLAVHLGLAVAVGKHVIPPGLPAAIATALSQAGLVAWSAGLGAFLATLLKDRNMLLPVALFLAGFDLFLVLTPIGFTKQLMQTQPDLLPTIGYTVPRVQVNPTFGPVAATAYVGPADLLFMGMFFVALFRFGMRTAETFRWLVPALAIYLGVVLFLGPLPALVPIGLCVLIVNWREFKLSKEEWVSTGVVAAIAAGAVIWGATRPAPPAEPSIPEAAPGVPAPPESLGQAPPSPPR